MGMNYTNFENHYHGALHLGQAVQCRDEQNYEMCLRVVLTRSTSAAGANKASHVSSVNQQKMS